MTIYEIRNYIDEQIEASEETDVVVNKAAILYNALAHVKGMLTDIHFKWDDLMPHEKAQIMDEIANNPF